MGLFRKGRIDEAALDAQLDDIVAEEESLRTRLAAARTHEPEQEVEVLASVPAMLEKLREKLDAGITWELTRQLVEVLVDGIRIDTVDAGNSREAVVNVRYRFVSSLHACTDRGSCHKRDLSLKPECRRGSIMKCPLLSGTGGNFFQWLPKVADTLSKSFPKFGELARPKKHQRHPQDQKQVPWL